MNTDILLVAMMAASRVISKSYLLLMLIRFCMLLAKFFSRKIFRTQFTPKEAAIIITKQQ